MLDSDNFSSLQEKIIQGYKQNDLENFKKEEVKEIFKIFELSYKPEECNEFVERLIKTSKNVSINN